MNDQYTNQQPSDCGSPNKYFSNNNVNDVGNSYGNSNVQDNAQSDIGFDVNNAEGTAGKRYMCSNCGTMHYGNEAPKNCCKCDGCSFREV